MKYLFAFVMAFGFVLTACAAEPPEYIMIRGTQLSTETHETENNLQYILYTAQISWGLAMPGFRGPSQIIREVRTVERASGVIIQTEQDVLKEILGHVEGHGQFRNIFRVW